MSSFPIKGEGSQRYVEFDDGKGTVYTVEVPDDFDPINSTHEELQALLDRGRMESVAKGVSDDGRGGDPGPP